MNLIFRTKYKFYVRLSMQHIISNVTPLLCLQLSLNKQYSTQNVHISLSTISIPKIPEFTAIKLKAKTFLGTAAILLLHIWKQCQ